MHDALINSSKIIPASGRLQVKHLRLMLAVGSSGSVTRAAQMLNLSQSALSHQLIDFEQELGALLFNRIGRRMAITPAGERLLAAARSILPQLAQVEADVVGLRAAQPKSLRVA